MVSVLILNSNLVLNQDVVYKACRKQCKASFSAVVADYQIQ